MASAEKFLTFRKMFGEYAIYKDQKVVALVCDNQLFVKPTPGGNALLGQPREAPLYPRAKPCFLIADGLDDPQLLSELIVTTARELPTRGPRRAAAQREPRSHVRSDGAQWTTQRICRNCFPGLRSFTTATRTPGRFGSPTLAFGRHVVLPVHSRSATTI
jgi:TfoX/Sxy family transcriptional regulator of competence genes